jgi:hypothetical protein
MPAIDEFALAAREDGRLSKWFSSKQLLQCRVRRLQGGKEEKNNK